MLLDRPVSLPSSLRARWEQKQDLGGRRSSRLTEFKVAWSGVVSSVDNHRTTSMAIAAAAITHVASHPKNSNCGRAVNLPMAECFDTTIIIAIIIGTAVIPLITALQKSAFKGSSSDQSMPIPSSVASLSYSSRRRRGLRQLDLTLCACREARFCVAPGATRFCRVWPGCG